MLVKQCVLKKENLITVAWIDSGSAEKGKWVEFDEDKTQWQVKEVGVVMVPASDMWKRAHQKVFESIK
jgi:hypothetical protein